MNGTVQNNVLSKKCHSNGDTIGFSHPPERQSKSDEWSCYNLFLHWNNSVTQVLIFDFMVWPFE